MLITGGTSGIGRATAQLFGYRGAKMLVATVTRPAAERSAETDGRFIRAYLTSPEDVRHLTAKAGEMDVLVNNAGFSELDPTARPPRRASTRWP